MRAAGQGDLEGLTTLLADDVTLWADGGGKVKGAALENGLLHVELTRVVPEAMKPRTIAIETATPKAGTKVIEGKAA